MMIVEDQHGTDDAGRYHEHNAIEIGSWQIGTHLLEALAGCLQKEFHSNKQFLYLQVTL